MKAWQTATLIAISAAIVTSKIQESESDAAFLISIFIAAGVGLAAALLVRMEKKDDEI
jgi:hypothetical protein